MILGYAILILVGSCPSDGVPCKVMNILSGGEWADWSRHPSLLGLCLKIDHEIEPFGRYLSLQLEAWHLPYGDETRQWEIHHGHCWWLEGQPPPVLPPGCSKAMSGKTERVGGTQQCSWSKNWGNGSGFRMVLVKTTALLSWRWSIFPLVKSTMAGESTGSIIFPNLCPFSKSK